MNTSAILVDLISKWGSPGFHPWWERAALEAIAGSRYWLIPTRDRSGPYLLRMWLSPAIAKAKATPGDLDRWESAQSLLLHYFFRGDDDQALHDHPWRFTTQILVGGYDEHLPPHDWEPRLGLGPAWDQRIVTRRRGEILEHEAVDLHCVGRIEPGTFTMVQTGPSVRTWGFHPPGQQWAMWSDYLGIAMQAQA